MMLYETDDASYVRDGSSRAVLNKDSVGYAAYKQRRQAILEQEQLRQDVADLKQGMSDILSLLEKLLREQNK